MSTNMVRRQGFIVLVDLLIILCTYKKFLSAQLWPKQREHVFEGGFRSRVSLHRISKGVSVAIHT